MIIIHGDDILNSRSFYLSIKKDPYIELNGNDLTLTVLKQNLGSTSLFGEIPVLIIENFFSRRTSTEKTKIIDFLLSDNYQIIFYDSKDISPQLKKFKPDVIKIFDLPKYLFRFLDTFSSDLLSKTLETLEPEIVLASLAKHLHNLILVKTGSLDLPGWQVQKFQSQASKYSLPKLINLNSLLLAVDLAQKTSTSPLSLSQALDLWCAKTIS